MKQWIKSAALFLAAFAIASFIFSKIWDPRKDSALLPVIVNTEKEHALILEPAQENTPSTSTPIATSTDALE